MKSSGCPEQRRQPSWRYRIGDPRWCGVFGGGVSAGSDSMVMAVARTG